MTPDGYWYFLVYDLVYQQVYDPAVGYIHSMPFWTSAPFYEQRFISGNDAITTVWGLVAQKKQPGKKGAIRAWWWNGKTWQRWPALDRDWNPGDF